MTAQETIYSKIIGFFLHRDWAKFALLISLSQCLIISTLESILLSLTVNGIKLMFGYYASTSLFIIIYFVLFIAAQFFQFILSLDAMMAKNSAECVAIAVFNVCTSVYAIVQIRQLNIIRQCGQNYLDVASTNDEMNSFYYINNLISTNETKCPPSDAFMFSSTSTVYTINGVPTEVYNITNLDSGLERISQGVISMNVTIQLAISIVVLMIVYNIIGIYSSVQVYDEYGWFQYQNKTGGSIKKKSMMQRYHSFILLLKLNVFFSCGIVLQMIGVIYYSRKVDPVHSGTSQGELSTTAAQKLIIPASIILAVVAIVFYVIGYFGVRKSSYSFTGAFLFLMVGNAAAICYVLYVVHQDPKYSITIIWLTTFSTIQLILNVATFANGILCMLDFSEGLKDLLDTRIISKQNINHMERIELD